MLQSVASTIHLHTMLALLASDDQTALAHSEAALASLNDLRSIEDALFIGSEDVASAVASSSGEARCWL